MRREYSKENRRGRKQRVKRMGGHGMRIYQTEEERNEAEGKKNGWA